jgi:hypothetical protein
MKHFCILLILIFSLFARTQAQTVNDWTQTDCEGTPHHFFEELDSGNVIVIEFIMTCNLCISGGQAVQEMLNNLTPQQQSKILFYQFAYNNTYTCQTMINFKNDNNFQTRVFDQGAHMVADYGGFGMPTVAIVGGPNHTLIYSSVGFITSDTTYAAPALRNYFATTGIDESENALKGFMIYPNPANENIHIEFNAGSVKETEIHLVDLSGREVCEVLPKQIITGDFKKQFDVSKIAAGYYMLKITVDKNTSLEKIRISH